MNWIGIITTLLTVVNILVSLLLVFVVLLQRPKNEGLGAAFGGDTASNIFGAQTTNVLANITRWLGALFLGLCFVIAILGSINPDRKSLSAAYIEKVKSERETQEAQKKAEEEAKAEALKVQGKNADGTPIEQEKPAATTPPVTPGPNVPITPSGATPPGTPAPATPSTNSPTASPVPVENSATPSKPEVPAPKPAENKPATEPGKPADAPKSEAAPAPEPVKPADANPAPAAPGNPGEAPKPQ